MTIFLIRAWVEYGDQVRFHAFVRRSEAKRFIEEFGFRALLVGGELNDVATSLLSSRDGPLEEVSADAGAAQTTVNPDALDRSPASHFDA